MASLLSFNLFSDAARARQGQGKEGRAQGSAPSAEVHGVHDCLPRCRGVQGGPRGRGGPGGAGLVGRSLAPWLWGGGQTRIGSLCAIEVEGLKHRPTEVGGLSLEFRV